MPRVTRAMLRSVEQHDESDGTSLILLPQTPVKDRVPLGETAGNKGIESKPVNTSEEEVRAVKKGIGKIKGNAAKNANKQPKENAVESHIEVLEDENQSTHSSAAKEACQDLLKDGSQGMLHRTSAFSCTVTNSWRSLGTPHFIVDNDRPQTPPSAAANTASEQLSPKSTTHLLNSEMYKPDDTTTFGSKEREDSFVAKIQSRTPLKVTVSEEIEMPLREESNGDHSFVDQIKTRTPGKHISRIEDSVEALDALEEEIEKVGGLIPASADGLQSHVNIEKQTKSQSTTTGRNANGSMRSKRNTDSQKKIGNEKSSTAVEPATSNLSTGTTNKRVQPSTSLAHQKTNTRAQATDSTHNVGQPIVNLRKRVSSVHKAPFQPMKSTKPLTCANFELPGDAVARKLKEQREERLKREEEEETPKPRVFKARPVRLSHAPEVKLTAATKARLSMAKGGPVNKTRPNNSFGNSKPIARLGPMATASANKRLSTLSIAKSSTQPTGNNSTQMSANGSARLTRGPSLNASTTIRAPSALGANRPAPTAEENAHQKLKGKEVFGRTKVEIMEREKVKKEKEDAARKARADAAERGRIASRQWAEKQKARKLEIGKVNEQGKALGA